MLQPQKILPAVVSPAERVTPDTIPLGPMIGHCSGGAGSAVASNVVVQGMSSGDNFAHNLDVSDFDFASRYDSDWCIRLFTMLMIERIMQEWVW
jgi:hypothetical protein